MYTNVCHVSYTLPFIITHSVIHLSLSTLRVCRTLGRWRLRVHNKITNNIYAPYLLTIRFVFLLLFVLSMVFPCTCHTYRLLYNSQLYSSHFFFILTLANIRHVFFFCRSIMCVTLSTHGVAFGEVRFNLIFAIVDVEGGAQSRSADRYSCNFFFPSFFYSHKKMFDSYPPCFMLGVYKFIKFAEPRDREFFSLEYSTAARTAKFPRSPAGLPSTFFFVNFSIICLSTYFPYRTACTGTRAAPLFCARHRDRIVHSKDLII